ncbi:MAG: hypothetical protein ACFE89_05610 [Candidatus Hodarchaeota archaeon]
MSKPCEITLELKEINHLFAAPVLDPFSEYYKPYTATAGIEFIYHELRGHVNRKEVVTTIILPEDQVRTRLEEDTKEAVQRYTKSKLREVSQDIRASWYKGIRLLILALIAFFLSQIGFLTIKEVIYPLTANPFIRILSEGVLVFGWVMLWVPLDLLVFEMWGHRLERTIFRNMANMVIVIRSVTP